MRTPSIPIFMLGLGFSLASCGGSDARVAGPGGGGSTGNTTARGGGTAVGGNSNTSRTSTKTSDPTAKGGTSTGGTSTASSTTGPSPSSTCKKGTSNLFVDLLKKSEAEVDSKVTTAVNRFFGIGTGESATPTANTGYRCYYELSSDPNSAYIWAADSNDVRSEGQSYGMMIAAQMNLQSQFDKLWNFAKKYMQVTSGGAWQYYFNWQGRISGSSVSFNNSGPAPDGDEYFAAALYVAHQRWGSAGSINYKQEADNIANAFLHNTGSATNCTIFNASQNQVVFYPLGNSCNFTDPSYHLPAFYELFALYGPSADSAKWKTQASASRSFLVKSAHGTTGLHPDYATFSGSPTTSSSGDGHDQFRYDAWRVVMNMAVDYAWFSSDASMKAQVEKYHSFFSKYVSTDNVTQSLFNLDGSNASGNGSTALTSTLAAGALASSASNRSTYVTNLWKVPQQSGEYRYYQESVYLLGLLATAGKYCYAF